MIKLFVPQIKDLLNSHLDAFEPIVKDMCSLYSDLLLAEYKGIYLTTPKTRLLKTHYKTIDGNYINGLIYILTGSKGLKNEDIIKLLKHGTSINIKPEYNTICNELLMLLQKLTDEAKAILIGEPDKLEGLSNSIANDFTTLLDTEANKKNVTKILNSIFNYGYFSDREHNEWGAYMLTKELNIGVCPYCNRNYTTTIIAKKKVIKKGGTTTITEYKTIRPHLDHFFSQRDYPILAISFYNLIPCCSVCNSSLKGPIIFKLTTHLHPYLYGFGNDSTFTFKYLPKETNSSYRPLKINLDVAQCQLNTQIIGSKDCFLLETIYQVHTDTVQEVIHKKMAYSNKYLEIISKQYRGLGLSRKDLYKLAFGAYLNEEDFSKRPLSKLIRDIANHLELL
jgi:hypothetical protein